MTDVEPRPIADTCWEICIPYYREILITSGLPADSYDELRWTSEPPDPTLPYKPMAGYGCPHAHRWWLVATPETLAGFERDNPMTWDMLPKLEGEFMCKVPRFANDSVGCDHYDTSGSEKPEHSVGKMLNHILDAHGAPWWDGFAHLVANYPEIENYLGSKARREAAGK